METLRRKLSTNGTIQKNQNRMSALRSLRALRLEISFTPERRCELASDCAIAEWSFSDAFGGGNRCPELVMWDALSGLNAVPSFIPEARIVVPDRRA
jgi:hypothetical protein